MGALAQLPLGQISAGALVAIIVLLIILGKMPTPQQHREALADRDYWRSSADTWQKVATEHGITLEKHTATLEKLLTYAETTQHVVTEIQQAATGGDR